MMSPSPDAGDPILRALRTLPRDRRNTAPETRARFEYQDECIALLLLEHLADDLHGVLVEHSTDVILIPREGLPELVSVKHREPHHRAEPGWTWAALQKDRVLADLHAAWVAAGRACTVAFHSNAGFSGPAGVLRNATAPGDPSAVREAVAALSRRLGVTAEEATAFLAALSFPRHPLPRRNEITDVGVGRTADWLVARGRSAVHAPACWEALLTRIAAASTDRPVSRRPGAAHVAATIRESLDAAALRTVAQRFVSAEETRDLLLAQADQPDAAAAPAPAPAPAPARQQQQQWEPDPLFVGREAELRRLTALLEPGAEQPVTPVVIHGLTGTGKTSLALQFAALHSGRLHPVLVDGSNRAALRFDLSELADEADRPGRPRRSIDLSGPVAASLPGGFDTLLIVDGVTDPATVQGLVPRRSACRVIITTTTGHIDEYQHVALGSWSTDETLAFVSQVLPATPPAEAERLAVHLGGLPLAVNQAVNYCRTVELDVPRYLDRLHKAATSVLSKGAASGHPVTVAAAVQLALQAVEERNPLARRLLVLLSHLGVEAVDTALFDEEPVRPFVIAAPSVPPARRGWRRLLRSGSPPPLRGDCLTLSDEGWQARSDLHDDVQRDEALACLRAFSLVALDGGRVSVHPLISLLIAEGTEDSATWTETAFGLFTSQLQAATAGSPHVLDRHVGHITKIVDVALRHDMHGPAVLAVGHALVGRLCALGDEELAVRLGGELLKVAERLPHDYPARHHMVFGMRTALVQAYVHSGNPQTALELAMSNLTFAQTVRDAHAVTRAYLQLGSAAVYLGRRDVAESVLGHIPGMAEIERLKDSGQPARALTVAHVRWRLLDLTNRLEEGAEAVAWSLACVRELGDRLPGDLVRVVHADAAMVGRLSRDPDLPPAYRYGDLREEPGHQAERTDRMHFKMRLDRADVAIGQDDLRLARELLEAVEAPLTAQFGVPSMMYATFLGIRGRLRLHEAMAGRVPPDAAVLDLTAAVEELRGTTGPERRGNLPAALINLAQAYALRGALDEAETAAREAYEEDLRTYGPDHPETQTDLDMLTALRTPPHRPTPP
ncbi:AAA family ATPase [Streptomyces sp. ADI95-16]|uniref:AAA family ATPase n=1 Tax=Streptomyces sp. ADI95-16 TaxID=1522758 RepID=UPI0013DD9444|nr:AAA family ATPase [Streptomyces sp. ADI95-16]